MSRTVVFVHGGWVTARCWDPFVSYFASHGFQCLAPAWPGKDRSVEEIRLDPSPLAGLGVEAIVARYERVIRALDEPPLIVGHSFGGLFVQMLLDRGLGSAGIAIDSAPPKGIFAFYPTSLLSLGRTLMTPLGWRKVVHWSFSEFRYAFVHTMPLEEAHAIWEAEIIPDSGRPFFEVGFSFLASRSVAAVNFANPTRAPLLLVAGLADRAMPPGVAWRTYRAYGTSPARTDLKAFAGRTHWIIAQPGWEEVAQACIDWTESLPVADQSGHAEPAEPTRMEVR